MRLIQASVVVMALVASTAFAQDADRKVAGGGITAKGWQGKIDPGKQNEGKSINDSKVMEMGGGLHMQVGPAAVYWNPSNTAKGDYMVKATFKETKVTSDHPHPYGLFIGGSKLDTETPNLLYCVAYGNGNVLVRGFSEGKVVNVQRPTPNAAVHKTGADGGVTQEIAWNVKGDKAECMVNGTVVASFPKADITGPGKLESTDGIYGIRVSHNLDVLVTGLSKK
jgi:hypothetical protein